MANRFDDFSENFSLEKSFKEWLETMFQSRASSDYPSRMRRFFRDEYPKLQQVSPHGGKEMYSLFGALMSQGASGRELAFTFLDLCICHAENERAKATTKEDKATFSNYRSALFAFQMFLLYLADALDAIANAPAGASSGGNGGVNVNGVCIPDVIRDLARRLHEGRFKERGLNAKVCDEARRSILGRLKDGKLTVSNRAMRDKFRSQLTTERRVSAAEGLLYPIDVIVTIINKHGTHGSVSNFWDEVIGEIKVIISENGDSIPFKDVSSIVIDYSDSDDGKGQLIVNLRDKRCAKVYTKVYTESGEKKYVPLRISSTSQINRDHDEPISNVLAGLSAADYPCLAELTDVYRNGESKKARDVRNRLATKLGGQITASYADELFDELKRLFELLHFTLMEERQNKRKSNKTASNIIQ